MVVPVVLYGSPLLRKQSVNVVEEDNINEIQDILFDTIRSNEGIGLAAPQAGILKRAFVIDTNPLAKQDITIDKFEGIFLNPEIIDNDGSNTVYREGCLSIPGIYEEVYRPYKIFVRYHDMSLKTHEEELEGLKARIFQHEFDHLEGILFTDRINLIRKKLILAKLHRLKKLSLSQKITNYGNII